MDDLSKKSIEQAYAPPVTDEETAAQISLSATHYRKRSYVFLIVSGVGVAGSIVVVFATDFRQVAFVGFLASAIIALMGAVFALIAMNRAQNSPEPPTMAEAMGSVGATLGNLIMMGLGGFGAYLSTMTFSSGRPFRRFGKVKLPPVHDGDAWALPSMSIEGVDPMSRAALAAQWRENGRAEHASVASFSQLSLDLVTLGAPPELIAAAHRNALDEIRHAQLCFALARGLDGKVESPGPFRAAGGGPRTTLPKPAALAQLAVESLIDGALHEGHSARVVSKLVKRCHDPIIREVLREIAADEGRHARHGWDVVGWCLQEGGMPVARALSAALHVIRPRTVKSPLPASARNGAWEKWGIMGEALEAEGHAAVRAELERRLLALLASHGLDVRAA